MQQLFFIDSFLDKFVLVGFIALNLNRFSIFLKKIFNSLIMYFVSFEKS